jgi:hypothetical protein
MVVALPETASKDEPPIQPPAPFLSDNLVDLHLLSAAAGALVTCVGAAYLLRVAEE